MAVPSRVVDGGHLVRSPTAAVRATPDLPGALIGRASDNDKASAAQVETPCWVARPARLAGASTTCGAASNVACTRQADSPSFLGAVALQVMRALTAAFGVGRGSRCRWRALVSSCGLGGARRGSERRAGARVASHHASPTLLASSLKHPSPQIR